MIELNYPYSYKQLCKEFNIKYYTGGSAKAKQISAIDKAYKIEHPLNPKTGKVKTNIYILREKYGEPDFNYDGRRKNGATALLSDEEYIYLWNYTMSERLPYDLYEDSDNNMALYISSNDIYSYFGINLSALCNDICSLKEREIMMCFGSVEAYQKVYGVYKNIVSNCIRNQSISKISRILGYSKNSLPKGILTRNNFADNYRPKDDLLNLYNEFEKEARHIFAGEYNDNVGKSIWQKCEVSGQTINTSNRIFDYIQERFRIEGYNHVVRRHKIILDEEKIRELQEFKHNKDYELVYALTRKIKEKVSDSTWESCGNMIYYPEEYKHPLSAEERDILDGFRKTFGYIHVMN